MKAIFVIDTSTLMDYPNVIAGLGEYWGAAVYVPKAVLKEIDTLKDKSSDEMKRRKAICAFRAIGEAEKKKYINTDRKSTFHMPSYKGMIKDDLSKRVDNIIISMALSLKNKALKKTDTKLDEVIIIAKDSGIRAAAGRYEGLCAMDWPFTPFDCLRMGQEQDEKAITRAKRLLALKYHSDHLGSLQLDEISNNYAYQRMQEVNNAYEKLEKNGWGWQKKSTPPPPEGESTQDNSRQSQYGSWQSYPPPPPPPPHAPEPPSSEEFQRYQQDNMWTPPDAERHPQRWSVKSFWSAVAAPVIVITAIGYILQSQQHRFLPQQQIAQEIHQEIHKHKKKAPAQVAAQTIPNRAVGEIVKPREDAQYYLKQAKLVRHLRHDPREYAPLFKKAFEMDPEHMAKEYADFAMDISGLTAFNLSQGNYTFADIAAMDALQTYIRYRQDNARIYFRLGLLYYGLRVHGDWEKATRLSLEMLERANAIDPSNDTTWQINAFKKIFAEEEPHHRKPWKPSAPPANQDARQSKNPVLTTASPAETPASGGLRSSGPSVSPNDVLETRNNEGSKAQYYQCGH